MPRRCRCARCWQGAANRTNFRSRFVSLLTAGRPWADRRGGRRRFRGARASRASRISLLRRVEILLDEAQNGFCERAASGSIIDHPPQAIGTSPISMRWASTRGSTYARQLLPAAALDTYVSRAPWPKRNLRPLQRCSGQVRARTLFPRAMPPGRSSPLLRIDSPPVAPSGTDPVFRPGVATASSRSSPLPSPGRG